MFTLQALFCPVNRDKARERSVGSQWPGNTKDADGLSLFCLESVVIKDKERLFIPYDSLCL